MKQAVVDSRQSVILWVVGGEVIVPHPNFLSFVFINSVIFLPVVCKLKMVIDAPVHLSGRIHTR